MVKYIFFFAAVPRPIRVSLHTYTLASSTSTSNSSPPSAHFYGFESVIKSSSVSAYHCGSPELPLQRLTTSIP